MGTSEKKETKRKKAITEIGRVVPSNFKFGIIVAIAIFWADFLKSVLNAIASLVNMTIPCLTELIIALLATAIAYFILVSYRRIQSRLKQIKI